MQICLSNVCIFSKIYLFPCKYYLLYKFVCTYGLNTLSNSETNLLNICSDVLETIERHESLLETRLHIPLLHDTSLRVDSIEISIQSNEIWNFELPVKVLNIWFIVYFSCENHIVNYREHVLNVGVTFHIKYCWGL